MTEAVTIQAEIPAPEDTSETVALTFEAPVTEEEVGAAITFKAEVPAEEEKEEAVTIMAEIPTEKEEVAEAITLQAVIPEEEAPKEEVTVVAAVAPKFLQELTTQEITEGETVHFEVKVSGTPKPEVTW